MKKYILVVLVLIGPYSFAQENDESDEQKIEEPKKSLLSTVNPRFSIGLNYSSSQLKQGPLYYNYGLDWSYKGPGLDLQYSYLPKNKIGWIAGLSSSSEAYVGDEKIDVMSFRGLISYRNDNTYFFGGISYSSLKAVLVTEQNLGYQAGVGYFYSRNWSTDLSYRTHQMRLQPGFSTGTYNSYIFGVKYYF